MSLEHCRVSAAFHRICPGRFAVTRVALVIRGVTVFVLTLHTGAGRTGIADRAPAVVGVARDAFERRGIFHTVELVRAQGQAVPGVALIVHAAAVRLSAGHAGARTARVVCRASVVVGVAGGSFAGIRVFEARERVCAGGPAVSGVALVARGAAVRPGSGDAGAGAARVVNRASAVVGVARATVVRRRVFQAGVRIRIHRSAVTGIALVVCRFT